MAMQSLLHREEIASLFFSYLDTATLSSLAQTCHQALFIYSTLHSHPRSHQDPPHPPEALPPHVTGSLPVAVQGASSTAEPSTMSITDTEYDTPSSTETESSTPEEAEWNFEITAAAVRRLSVLPRFSSGPTLPGLPNELQIEIFSYLDKIDSTCLGLTARNTYCVYRALYGVGMPLTTRRTGPNTLESCWEVKGAKECRHCGPYRCELWRHVQTWMPEDLEYCAMKQNFGSRAKEGANATCYRGKPSKPRRCGRHPVRTTTIHQDDNLGFVA